MSIPDYIAERLRLVSNNFNVNYDLLCKTFLEKFNDPLLVNDPQFQDEQQRAAVALLITRGDYERAISVKEVQVLTVGYEGLRITQTKKGMSSIYVLRAVDVEGQRKFVLRRVSCLGPIGSPIPELYKSISLFNIYDTLLSEYSSGGDFGADSRTTFKNPRPTNMTGEQLRQILGIKITPIAQLRYNLSRPQENDPQYTDTCDWKCIRGVIADENRGKRKDGSEWAYYRVIDSSVPSEPSVLPDGTEVSPGQQCWLPPEMQTIGKGSFCDFFGSVVQDKDGAITFNCYSIIPIISRGERSE